MGGVKIFTIYDNFITFVPEWIETYLISYR